MEKVINLGIPHVGETIFEQFDTPGLIQCLLVSESWKILAENVLIKRWKGRLFEVCKRGDSKIVELLLDHSDSKIELNAKHVYGWTAFMLACYKGHNDVVKLLLDHSETNIDLNAISCIGRTAFMLACIQGHKNVVKVLLDHDNIDLNAISKSGDILG